ncbi:MAG: peptidase S10 [Proteobacteria bacterium]|nr:peptidase S10 [Pseudomonadota bacterium]
MRILMAWLLLTPAMAVPAWAAPDSAIQQPVGPHAAVVTHLKGRFNGQKIRYTATVEGSDVADPSGQTRIVSFAYTRDGVKDTTRRPVTFLFNGGPIVASAWVHLGGLGPYRVAIPDQVGADPATFRIVENEYSPLDVTDLVFVDPASTGWSRVAAGTRPDAYYSVKADAQQFVAFIKAWLAAHGRADSPVYVFGESYGTNRAAEIAGQVADAPATFHLAGVFLYGQAVNIIEYAQRPANIVSYAVSLPTLAAIAWYHGHVDHGGKTQEVFLDEARSFARTEYLPALFQGNGLPAAEQQRIAARLEQFSGIPAAWYLAHTLRITKEEFRLELLKDRGLLLGRSDARYVAPVGPKGRADDPSNVLPATVAKLFETYRRETLHLNWPEPYLTGSPVAELEDWDWSGSKTPFGDWPYAQRITKLMAVNPSLRVVVANGWYDTSTTVGAAELLVAQAGWDPARTRLRFYDGGHMGYSVAATARAIGEDIREWVK